MNKFVYLNSALKQISSKSSLLRKSLNLGLSKQASASYGMQANSTSTKSQNSISTYLVSKKSLHLSSLYQKAHQDAEKVVSKTSEKFEFLAETKQLLNIVAKSLYSDKEVFVRELISNASDAIEKLKYAQLSGDQIASTVDQNAIPFEIQIIANDMNNTLTIQVFANFDYFINSVINYALFVFTF